MNRIPPAAFIGGAIVLGVIALILLVGFRPRLSMSPVSPSSSSPSGIEMQTEGVIKGTDSFNLPGTNAYPTITPPVRQNQPQPAPTPAPAPGVACTMEAMLCPDGSYVGRTGPNCAFAPCPGN